MSAEQLSGPQPGEKTTDSGFIVPEESKFSNGHGVRETIDFGDMKNGERSDKYNTSGADLDSEYSALYRPETAQDAPYAVEVEEAEEAAGSQPRRVRRNEEGVTERLVKDSEGGFAWEVIGADSEKLDTHGKVLEQIADAVDAGEQKNEKQDIELDELRAEVAELKAVIDELRAQKFAEASVDNDELIEDAEVEPTPGKEVELYVEPSAEVEMYDEPSAELDVIDAEEIEAEIMRGSVEALESLGAAAGNYAELTAKSRKGYLGQLLQNSKYLVKVPLFKKAADKLNQLSDKKLDAARDEYRDAMNSVQESIVAQYEAQYEESERGEDYEAEVRMAKQFALLQSNADLEDAIVAERHEQGGKAGWLTKQLSEKGSLKGKLAIAGTAAAVGFGVSMLGGGKWGGMLAGGATGATMGHQVNRRRANSIGEDGSTLAERQSREDRANTQDAFKDMYDDAESDDATVEDIIRTVQQRTASERQGNRERLAQTAAVGAAAGGLGGGLGEMLQGTVGAQPVIETDPTTPDSALTADVVPEVVPPVEVLQADPTIGNYDYPWNWAADQFGADGASDTLKRLGELAAQDGHTIQWNGEGFGEWVQVDGASDSQSVLDILSRYTSKL